MDEIRSKLSSHEKLIIINKSRKRVLGNINKRMNECIVLYLIIIIIIIMNIFLEVLRKHIYKKIVLISSNCYGEIIETVLDKIKVDHTVLFKVNTARYYLCGDDKEIPIEGISSINLLDRDSKTIKLNKISKEYMDKIKKNVKLESISNNDINKIIEVIKMIKTKEYKQDVEVINKYRIEKFGSDHFLIKFNKSNYLTRCVIVDTNCELRDKERIKTDIYKIDKEKKQIVKKNKTIYKLCDGKLEKIYTDYDYENVFYQLRNNKKIFDGLKYRLHPFHIPASNGECLMSSFVVTLMLILIKQKIIKI